MEKMNDLSYKRPKSKYNKIFKKSFIVLMVVILACVYMLYIFGKHKKTIEEEILQFSETISSLLYVDYIEMAIHERGNEKKLIEKYIEESLVDLVEATDFIYYAYVLKEESEKTPIIADSSIADGITSKPIKQECEITNEANLLSFKNKQSLIASPISTSDGKWIRTLTPIYDNGQKNVIAVLGLSFSAYELQLGIWKRIFPNIAILIVTMILIFTAINLYYKHKKLVESERSKSVILSHLPGMAYRCKNDLNWTMEFVSEGCYDLTGYEAEDFIGNKMISFKKIIYPKHYEMVRKNWEQALRTRKHYRDEYELITKSKKHKWVLELGQGVYDDNGKIEAFEGIILDITENKMKDYQIKNLENYDFITGLFNRYHMEQEIVKLDNLKNLPLSVAICDIDGLRVVNDVYGHEEGDKLIVKAGKLIQSSLHDEYILGHLGGGEFIIYLPNTDGKTVYRLKESIKNKVKKYNEFNDNLLYTISISIGYSTKNIKKQKIEDVIKEAEKYLARRKLLNENSSHSAIVSSIMVALYAKSQETEEHGQRLAGLCVLIGKKMGLSQVELDDLQLLSKLHDIGKIGIDDYILNKPGKLNEDEWKIMRQHPRIGYRIAMSIPQISHIAEYILYHHERWDGTGYPMGLVKDETPLIPRILSIADAYDAMTEDRIYRKALPKDVAIKEIEKNAGKQFDPHIARLFVEILKNEEKY